MLAIYRAGLKKVILPERNKKDLVEVPKKVRDNVEIILTTQMDNVLLEALYPPAETPGRYSRQSVQANVNDSDDGEPE